MRVTVGVLFALSLAHSSSAEEEVEEVACEDACRRLSERTFRLVNTTHEKALRTMEKTKDVSKMRDVCWRMHDYLYCMKGCAKSSEHDALVREVKVKCTQAISDLIDGLTCLHSYRLFLETRCSSFMHEVVSAREASDLQYLPDKHICRYLHLYAICLENSVSSYCPSAQSFFKRLTLRDYFLSFILPRGKEHLLDDFDLDHCQMKDFVREALMGVSIVDEQHAQKSAEVPLLIHSPTTTLQQSTTTAANFHYSTHDDSASSTPTVYGRPIFVTRDDLVRAFAPTPSASSSDATDTVGEEDYADGEASTKGSKEEEETTIVLAPDTMGSASTHRRVFESDEELAHTPPNFHYSSVRGEFWRLLANESVLPASYFVTPISVEVTTDEKESDSPSTHYSTDFADSSTDPPPVTLFASKQDDEVEEERKEETLHRIHPDPTLTTTTVQHPLVKLQPAQVENGPSLTTTTLHHPLLELKPPQGEVESAATTTTTATTHVQQTIEEDLIETTVDNPLIDLLPAEVEEKDEWKEEEVRVKSSTPHVLPTDSYEDYEEELNLHDDGVLLNSTTVRSDEDEKEIVQEKTTEEEKASEKITEENTDDSHSTPSVSHDRVAQGDDYSSTTDAMNEENLEVEEEEEEGGERMEDEWGKEEDRSEGERRWPLTLPPFTPLINGGVVAVKPIKHMNSPPTGEEMTTIFRDGGDSDASYADDTTEAFDLEESNSAYDDQVTITLSSETEEEKQERERKAHLNFVIVYTALFLLLFLIVVGCTAFVIYKNRKGSESPYKLHDSL